MCTLYILSVSLGVLYCVCTYDYVLRILLYACSPKCRTEFSQADAPKSYFCCMHAALSVVRSVVKRTLQKVISVVCVQS